MAGRAAGLQGESRGGRFIRMRFGMWMIEDPVCRVFYQRDNGFHLSRLKIPCMARSWLPERQLYLAISSEVSENYAWGLPAQNRFCS